MTKQFPEDFPDSLIKAHREAELERELHEAVVERTRKPLKWAGRAIAAVFVAAFLDILTGPLTMARVGNAAQVSTLLSFVQIGLLCFLGLALLYSIWTGIRLQADHERTARGQLL